MKKVNWYAWCLLALVMAMQVSLLLKGLHNHASACHLSGHDHSEQVLHAHDTDDEDCACDAFHFPAATLAFPPAFSFAKPLEQSTFQSLYFEKAQLFSSRPLGRAPPAIS